MRSDDADEDAHREPEEARHSLGDVGGAPAIAQVADLVGGVADNRDVDDVAAGNEPDVAAPFAVRRRGSFARSLRLQRRRSTSGDFGELGSRARIRRRRGGIGRDWCEGRSKSGRS